MSLGHRSGSRPWRIITLLVLIGAGILTLRLQDSGQVKPLFLPTPTPTRTAHSYQDEAEARFSAGDMGQAIAAYQRAVENDPQNATLWAELARVQTYYSSLQANRDNILARLSEARQSIDKALELAPEDPFVLAVRTLVYDWSSSAYIRDNPSLHDDYLKEANESVQRARNIDPTSILVRAYYAEVLVDEGKYVEAYEYARQAAEDAERVGGADPGAVIDAHRVFGLVLENNGEYRSAIEQYQKAIQINPNLTFLYLRMGANYRRLAGSAANQAQRSQLIDQALEAFDRAAKINDQNQIEDPIPYLAIGRTYLQEGEFFVSARNVERAVLLDPTNPELYGFLGIVYYKGRNYESARQVLACAVEGCDQAHNAQLLCEDIQIVLCEEDQLESFGYIVPGLQLSSDSLEYYYTYASALAFLHRPENNYCAKAQPYFDQLMIGYGNDPIVSEIVRENQSICQTAEQAGLLPTATPASLSSGESSG